MAQLSSYQRSKSKKCRTIWHWNVHCISIRPKLAAHTQCFTQKVANITFYTGPNERFINVLGQLIRKYGLLETFVIRHKFVFQKQLFWWKHLYSEFRYFPFILKPWNCLNRPLHLKKMIKFLTLFLTWKIFRETAWNSLPSNVIHLHEWVGFP